MTATIAATTLQERASGKLGTGVLAYVVLLGRIFYSAIFIMSGPNHFKAETIGYAAAQGVPLASIAVPLSGIIALLGGLSIALGYRAKLGAWLIVLFLVPVTLTMHRFWGLSGLPALPASASHVHEEPVPAGRRPDNRSIGLGPAQPQAGLKAFQGILPVA